MVEGQQDLDWERWLHILHLTERLGFPSLFRSDHYFITDQRASLETWTSLAVAARETSTIRFGPLVAPVTFRHPVDVGRMAAQIDLLSGGAVRHGAGPTGGTSRSTSLTASPFQSGLSARPDWGRPSG